MTCCGISHRPQCTTCEIAAPATHTFCALRLRPEVQLDAAEAQHLQQRQLREHAGEQSGAWRANACAAQIKGRERCQLTYCGRQERDTDVTNAGVGQAQRAQVLHIHSAEQAQRSAQGDGHAACARKLLCELDAGERWQLCGAPTVSHAGKAPERGQLPRQLGGTLDAHVDVHANIVQLWQQRARCNHCAARRCV